MKFDTAEMAIILEQAKQEAQKQRLGHKEIQQIDILDRESLEFAHDEESNIYAAFRTETISISVLEVMNQGLACEVQFDENVYSCIPSVFQEGLVTIGNVKFLGGDDTEEPFLYLVREEGDLILSATGGAHTIAIYTKQVTIHHIPQEYIPPLDALYLNGTDGVRYKLYVDAAGQLQVEVV